jgi:hypothetical protein
MMLIRPCPACMVTGSHAAWCWLVDKDDTE